MESEQKGQQGLEQEIQVAAADGKVLVTFSALTRWTTLSEYEAIKLASALLVCATHIVDNNTEESDDSDKRQDPSAS